MRIRRDLQSEQLLTSFLKHLARYIRTLRDLRVLLLSTHCLLLTTFGSMKASAMQSALRLLRNMLRLVIAGNSKLNKLQSQFLLFRLLIIVFPHHNAHRALWSPMMSPLNLTSPLMMIRLDLLLSLIPFLLRMVVIVSALSGMRELHSVVHAKAKG